MPKWGAKGWAAEHVRMSFTTSPQRPGGPEVFSRTSSCTTEQSIDSLYNEVIRMLLRTCMQTVCEPMLLRTCMQAVCEPPGWLICNSC